MPKRRGARGATPLAVVAIVLAVVAALAVPAYAAPAPNTVIDSGPAATTKLTSASFTFHSTRGGATFSCKLDSAAFATCSSPASYSGLAAGQHTFAVRATVKGSTDPTPATYTWTIDTIAPSAPTNLAAPNPGATAVNLTWAAGIDNVGVTGNIIYRDGSQLATVGAVTSFTDTTVTASTAYQYAVAATDGAGNVSSTSASLPVTTAVTDPTPDTVIDSAPAAVTTSSSASFSFHSTVPGSTFACSLDGGSAAACTSPAGYSGLAQGTHTFSVTATAGGQTDPTPASVTWAVDTVAPSVPTGLSTSASGTSVALSWQASTDATGVAGYDVFRDGTLLTSIGAVTSYSDGGLTLGRSYGYSVRARDAAGNVSALSGTVSAQAMYPYAAQLTRSPYLTDLVGLHVAINFATDQSGTTASVRYGPVGSGGCSLTDTVVPNRITIQVGTVSEYQWTAQVDVPAAGTYCYRVYLGTTDLLGQNASPQFTTQVQIGDTSGFTFDVIGDWGQINSSGSGTDQANLLAQMAKSGARFAVTVGDNGYPNGNQVDYGDLQHPATSAIFGPGLWGVPGATIPLFAAPGNHGLAGVQHTDITTWTQARAVGTSGGRYQNDVYCCVNGSFSANYGSEWYAFDVGNARFYILDSAWGDTNGGTATPYANDALAHFAPGTPQYEWLLNDLRTHTPQLKFAFSHYPLYSDNPSQPSDTYLQGAANLEGLLGQNGVQMLFNGHAHIYQRNTPSAAGMPITYVTGGGGGTLEPVGPCVTANDAYAIGWSPTRLVGSACGRGTPPTSAANTYHFLKVSVTGTRVTVAPTDSLGNTFDVQTYTFKVPPDTYIDSAPPVGTTSNSATFAFHASSSPASFTCQLDGGATTSCTSPITYSGLAERAHTLSVRATVGKSKDPTPATYAWTVDSTSPTDPGALTATAVSPFEVDLGWTASTDNTGVTGYDLFRDDVLYKSLGPVTSYADTLVDGSSTHTYSIRARDVAGNLSSLVVSSPVTTPPPPVPLFADGFESGTLANWKPVSGLTVESANVHGGTYAVEGSTTNGGTYAKLTLPGTYADAYARVWFDVLSQQDQVNLLRLRDAAGSSLGYVYVETTGQLGFHDDAANTNTLSSTVPGPGWHALELHLQVGATAGALGVAQIWLDGVLVDDLSSTAVDVGSAPVGGMQIGETQTGRTYDVAFDDVAFGTSRLGRVADTTAPSAPAGVTGSATSAFSAQLSWSASSDDAGVVSYTVLRDGVAIATVDGGTLSYTDTGVLASTTYSYAVQAVDLAGNRSQPGTTSVTTPAADPPLFADGFESGNLSAWSIPNGTNGGLVVESSTFRSGGYAAESSGAFSAGYAKRTLGGTYQDAYARVAFQVKAQGSSTLLLRLRDTSGGTGGYVYLTTSGVLAFRSDKEGSGRLSALSPDAGWHVVELHLSLPSALDPTSGAGTGSADVWLDGAPVAGLTGLTVSFGVTGIGSLQVGDTQASTSTGRDIVFDDAAFGTSRLGL